MHHCVLGIQNNSYLCCVTCTRGVIMVILVAILVAEKLQVILNTGWWWVPDGRERLLDANRPNETYWLSMVRPEESPLSFLIF